MSKYPTVIYFVTEVKYTTVSEVAKEEVWIKKFIIKMWVFHK